MAEQHSPFVHGATPPALRLTMLNRADRRLCLHVWIGQSIRQLTQNNHSGAK
jgi:hypothetical protein